MLPDTDLKAICSVTEMAKKLDLSRARFYQLQKMGVFPKPVYCPRTRRPFYPLDLQKKCIDIRKTGISYNGQPVLFYASRKDTSGKLQNQSDHQYGDLTDILRRMGLNVSLEKVKNTVKSLYREGLTRSSVEGPVIRDLFRYFYQRV